MKDKAKKIKEPTKEQWKAYYAWRDQTHVIDLSVYQWVEKYDIPTITKNHKKI